LNVQPFGVNYLSLADDVSDGGAGAAIEVTGLTSGATIEFRDNADMTDILTVTIDGAAGAGSTDTLNLSFNANIADQANAGAAIEYNLGIDGIENLVITTADRANADGATTRDDGYILDLAANEDNLESITVSGTSEFSYTASLRVTDLETFTASGLSGDLILDLSASVVNDGVVITGGSGQNFITGSDEGDSIVGGALVDSITGGSGADTMTGGAGADEFAIDETGTDSDVTVNGNTVSGFDVITDYASGEIIDFVGGATAGAAGGPAAAATTVVISAGGKATFHADDDTLSEKVIAIAADDTNVDDGEAVFFEHDGSTYIYHAGVDTTVATDDALIKLLGVTGFTTLTIAAGDATLV